MEDQTIEDIDKVKKSTPEKDNSLSEIDPVRMPVHDLDTADNNVQNGEQHNYDDQLMFLLMMMLKRNKRSSNSTQKRQSSTRYTSNEYVTLTDGKKPECYQESMGSEERQKVWQSKLQKYVALSTTKTDVGFVQNEH
ncbi:hypothetical protein CR513_47887, partial [Mucuna pruriens]